MAVFMKARTIRRGWALAVALTLVVAVLAMLFATRVWAWQGASVPVVTGEVSGTITMVNGPGDAICLKASGTGEQVCSGIWWPSSDGQVHVPRVGDSISVWVERVPVGPARWMDQFVVKPAGS